VSPAEQLDTERRRDRRIQVAAKVRIVPQDGAPTRSGRLLDVSAGGLRAACRDGSDLRPGSPVDVEITVQEDPRGPAPVGTQFRGCALVVRISEQPAGEAHAALRFVGPLSLREPFAQMLLF